MAAPTPFSAAALRGDSMSVLLPSKLRAADIDSGDFSPAAKIRFLRISGGETSPVACNQILGATIVLSPKIGAPRADLWSHIRCTRARDRIDPMKPIHLGEALPKLVDRIVQSYEQDERIQHIDRDYLPSPDRALRICELLLQLTYPGGYGRRGLTRHNIRYHVGELVPLAWELLRDEIFHCHCHEIEREGALPDDLSASHALACRQATEFFDKIPETRAALAEDVQAHYDGDPAAGSTTEVVLSYPGMLAITIHRYAHTLYQLGVPKLPRIMSEWAHRQTGIDIHPGAKIGRSFCIDHGTGVVIGETAEIGDFVKIYQGVTLGALSIPKDDRGRAIRGRKRHPTIGNNVTIYANAIILGGDTTIGDGAVVGGSVFLTHSVAPGHQVSLTPPLLRVRPPKKPKGDDFGGDWVI